MIGNCMKMVRIQLINQFKLNELKHGRPSKIILMVFVALCVVGVLSGYTVLLATGLAAVGLAEVIPAYALTITSLVSLFFTIFKTNGILFVYKDYDMLMSLPITNVTLITSRFFSLYLINTLFSALVTIPMGIVYCIYVNPSPVVYIMWILAVLTETLIPTVIGAAIGALIIALASRFKFANMVAIIVSVAALLAYMGFMFGLTGSSANLNVAQLTNMAEALSSQIYRLYPISRLFHGAVWQENFLYMLAFIAMSAVIYAVFAVLVGFKYNVINTGLTTYHVKSDYKLTTLKVGSPLKALYLKEVKRFFSCFSYVLNMGIGVILLLAAAIGFAVVGVGKMEALLGMPGFVSQFAGFLPLIIASLLSMSCTSAVSLSLEGKNLWILQSLPVDTSAIFKAKILFNLSLTLPSGIISGMILGFVLGVDYRQMILMILVPAAFALFSAVFGMYINIMMPVYGWESETRVIKQSMSSMIGMLGGAAIPLVCLGLGLLLKISPVYVGYISTLAALIISFILYTRICRFKLISS